MKKGKRILFVLIVLCLGLCALALAACGETPTHKHDYKLKHDETHHWWQCDVSGCDTPQKDKAQHTYGEWKTVEDATETKKGTKKRECSVCRYEQTDSIPALSHKHSLTPTAAKAADCTHDGNSAYWYCAGCEKYFSDDKGEHETTLAETVIKASHTPSAAVRENEVAADCTHAGSYDEVVKCSVCDTEISRTQKTIQAKGHSYRTTWDKDDAEHWHECSGCGDKKDKANHTYGEWETVEAATETKKGTKKRECSVCRYEQTDSIPALPHKHSLAPTAAKAADCTHDGNTEYWHCAGCEKYFSDANAEHETTLAETVIKAKGHTPSAAVRENEVVADCTHAGSYDEVVKCSVCDTEISRTGKTVPATGHSYKTTWDKDGTEHWHECSVCGDKKDVAEHDFSNGDCVCEQKAPTGGLKYTLNAYGESYSCTGIGTATETDIIIASVYNGKPVTSIGEDAFRGCSSLTSITIPDSVTSIGNYAFEGCSSLTRVNITDIAAWCEISFGDYYSNPLYYAHNFYVNNELVTELVIPGGVMSIGSYAFSGCRSLTSITIPDSVMSIGSYAFSGCRSLTSITIPDSVTSIGYEAFWGCSSLMSITLPDSVTSIGSYAFYGCNSLRYNEYDNAYYLGNESNPYVALIKTKGASITSCTVNSNTKVIAGSAFEDCRRSLTSVTIGSSVTSIGSLAFWGFRNLTSITIGNSVTSIGEAAFRDCNSLTSVTIPESVTSIGDYAFA